MTRAATHAAYERVLASALRADDPVASVRAAAAEPDCSPALRRTLIAACAHEAGLRMSALITTRLRFERLLNGSPRATRLFADDPEQSRSSSVRTIKPCPPPPTAHDRKRRCSTTGQTQSARAARGKFRRARRRFRLQALAV
jgi:hypothetical protein